MIDWRCYRTVYDGKHVLAYYRDGDEIDKIGSLTIIQIINRFLVVRFFKGNEFWREETEVIAEFPTLEDAQAAAELMV